MSLYNKVILNRHIKNGIAIALGVFVANTALFASVDLPQMRKTISSVPEGGKWVYDDRTEFTKEKGMGFIDVPNPVINNVYLLNEDSLLSNSGENFVLLNECSGMEFAFSWSAVRVVAIKETMNEVKRYIQDYRIEKTKGSSFKVIEEKRDNRTGEMYLRYSWKTSEGKLINGYMHGIYYQKKMLINLTMEWCDKEGKQRAISSFESLKEQLDLQYDIKI